MSEIFKVLEVWSPKHLYSLCLFTDVSVLCVGPSTCFNNNGWSLHCNSLSVYQIIPCKV